MKVSTKVSHQSDEQRSFVRGEDNAAKFRGQHVAAGNGGLHSEEAALSIVRAVRQRDKMKTLRLADCGIGASGAQEIPEYVRVSGALTQLDLSGSQLCGIDDGRDTYASEGINAIADALRVNGALTSINLLRNELDAASAGTTAVSAKDDAGTAVDETANAPDVDASADKITETEADADATDTLETAPETSGNVDAGVEAGKDAGEGVVWSADRSKAWRTTDGKPSPRHRRR